MPNLFKTTTSIESPLDASLGRDQASPQVSDFQIERAGVLADLGSVRLCSPLGHCVNPGFARWLDPGRQSTAKDRQCYRGNLHRSHQCSHSRECGGGSNRLDESSALSFLPNYLSCSLNRAIIVSELGMHGFDGEGWFRVAGRGA